MNWTGAANHPEFIGATNRKLYIYGSLTFIPEMAFIYTGEVHFKSAIAGRTITSAGHSFKRHVYFDGEGSYTLMDSFTQTGNFYLYFVRGTLNFNNQAVTAQYFWSNYTNIRTLNMGSSVFTITGGSTTAFYYNGSNFNFNAGQSQIVLTAAGSGISHAGTGLAYHHVHFDALSGTNSVQNTGGSAQKISLPALAVSQAG